MRIWAFGAESESSQWWSAGSGSTAEAVRSAGLKPKRRSENADGHGTQPTDDLRSNGRRNQVRDEVANGAIAIGSRQHGSIAHRRPFIAGRRMENAGDPR